MGTRRERTGVPDAEASAREPVTLIGRPGDGVDAARGPHAMTSPPDARGLVTPVQDRDYFRSIYFREPRGVLFEIATLSPGFAADEDPEHLGEELRVPRMHARLRGHLQQTLTPLVNPRTREQVGA